MKVILLKNIPMLGGIGSVKEVAEGYARNYLIPQKLAAVAPKGADVTALKPETDKEKINTAKLDFKQSANKLRSINLSFAEKADEAGTFFAGITKEKIARALVALGYKVKPKQIILTQAIKKAGAYKVEINVSAGIKSEIRVEAKAEI